MSQKPLDDSMLQNLLKPKEEKARAYTRSEEADLSVRTVTTWFKASIRRYEGTCSYGEKGECESPSGPNRTVAEIDGVVMCRWCFIGGKNK